MIRVYFYSFNDVTLNKNLLLYQANSKQVGPV